VAGTVRVLHIVWGWGIIAIRRLVEKNPVAYETQGEVGCLLKNTKQKMRHGMDLSNPKVILKVGYKSYNL
jgi:hypothetical protein